MPGGTHAPHHPTPEWIEKIHDMHLFDEGWNKLRDTIFANQKKLGVIPPGRQNDPLAQGPAEALGQAARADEKKMFIRQVEVYAAYLAYTDHEIGRVIQAVEDMGKLDNTLIIYISGDNGSSAEGTLIGTPNEVAMFNGVDVPVEDQLKYFYDVWGTRQDLQPHGGAVDLGLRHAVLLDQADRLALRRHPARAWRFLAGAYQGRGRYPQPVPPRHRRRADDPGSQRHSRRRRRWTASSRAPIEGVSFAYTFDKANANAPSRHNTQYFEMFGDHAIYHDGWIASTKVIRPPWVVAGLTNPDPLNNCTWELYDLSKDWTQFDDVAAKYPEKLEELKALFLKEAEKYQVLPLDASVATRSSRRGRTSPRAVASSSIRGRSPAFRKATRRCCSTRRTPSRPTWRFPRAAPKGCSSPRAAASAATASTSSRASRCSSGIWWT